MTAPEMTAAQIVEKNVAARGGLEAWRKIETMAWAGHIESGNVPGAALPFVLEMKRPDKTRFEVHVQNQRSVRMYDGSHGWKLHPARDGQPDLQPYTAEELKFAHDAEGIDGPLMDYQAKGVSVALEGVDKIGGNQAYRLSVKLPSGASHHVWIDAQSFLEVQSDREAHNAVGMSGTVTVHYRDYRTIDGLQIPFMIESGGSASQATDKMVIDRIALNPPLEDWMFARPPGVPRHMIRAGAGFPGMIRRPNRPGAPALEGIAATPNPGAVLGSGNVR
jgi:hypothetical protein